MNWNDLRYFLAVARTGSLTRAAQLLGTSQSTVARRVETLESALGAVLFTRHASGYLPTDEGTELLTRAESVEQQVRTLQDTVMGRDAELSGSVRLAVSIAVANLLLVPYLAAFREAFPHIRLELASGISYLNMTRREADMAVRLSRPESGPLTVRRIGVLAHAVYGHTDYVARNCPARSREEINACDFIRWGDEYHDIPMARWLEQQYAQAGTAFTADDINTHIVGAKAGLGLVMLPCFCADGEPELVRVVPPEQGFERELFLLTHKEVRNSARIRAVADFLVAHFEKLDDVMRGTAVHARS